MASAPKPVVRMKYVAAAATSGRPSAEKLSAPGSEVHDSTTPAPWTASTTTPTSKSVVQILLPAVTFRCRRQSTLVAATTIVSRGPRSSSDATSTAQATGNPEPVAANGKVTLNAAVAAASAIITANSTGCCGMSVSGGRTAITAAAVTMTVEVKTRPAAADSLISGLVNPWSGGHPQIAPVFLQQRPEHLVHIFAAAPDRLAQHAFLDGAEFSKGAIRAAVLERDASLETMHTNRAERERSNQPCGFEKHAGAAPRRRDRAFPLGALPAEVDLSGLYEADDRAGGTDGDDVRERGARRALAAGAVDQLLHRQLGRGLVDAERCRVAD